MKKQPLLFIFDLDGVLTDTAHYHYLAWKQLSNELGYHFDETINERLKGVSRIRSFEIILEVNNATDRFSEAEKEALANKKNDIYVELITKITKDDILEGVEEFLNSSKAHNIKIAVASASKNAFTVLDRLGILSLFDYVADAALIKNAKPDPEVFLNCSTKLGIPPELCIGFEDAEAGIMAIHSANMFSVGINVQSDIVSPNLPLKCTKELSLDKIIEAYQNV